MKRMGGSTINHTIKQAAYATATATRTTNIHVAGSTIAAMANGTKQQRNTTVSQMASLMRQTVLTFGSSWCAGKSFMRVLLVDVDMLASSYQSDATSPGAASTQNCRATAHRLTRCATRESTGVGKAAFAQACQHGAPQSRTIPDVSRETSVWVGRGFPVQYTQDSKLRAKRGSHAL